MNARDRAVFELAIWIGGTGANEAAARVVDAILEAVDERIKSIEPIKAPTIKE